MFFLELFVWHLVNKAVQRPAAVARKLQADIKCFPMMAVDEVCKNMVMLRSPDFSHPLLFLQVCQGAEA